jgi:ssDNA thymidine ADP-ribosyltransferase, DarT
MPLHAYFNKSRSGTRGSLAAVTALAPLVAAICFFCRTYDYRSKNNCQRHALCRRDLAGQITHDVANQEALGTNPSAHDFVRLYFRPKTHFHLRTGGIKLLSDHFRLPSHMSMPIMFAFDLTKVVTRPKVAFCDRKMAHAGIAPGYDQAYFDAIDFAKVYHDTGISDPVTRQDINDRRMAEVLVPDSLPLKDALDMIICRTRFDAMSLLSMIDLTSPWRVQVRVATKPAEMFFCWGAYITDLQHTAKELTLKLKPSKDYIHGATLKFNIRQTFRARVRYFGIRTTHQRNHC